MREKMSERNSGNTDFPHFWDTNKNQTDPYTEERLTEEGVKLKRKSVRLPQISTEDFNPERNIKPIENEKDLLFTANKRREDEYREVQRFLQTKTSNFSNDIKPVIAENNYILPEPELHVPVLPSDLLAVAEPPLKVEPEPSDFPLHLVSWLGLALVLSLGTLNLLYMLEIKETEQLLLKRLDALSTQIARGENTQTETPPSFLEEDPSSYEEVVVSSETPQAQPEKTVNPIEKPLALAGKAWKKAQQLITPQTKPKEKIYSPLLPSEESPEEENPWSSSQ